MTTAPALDLSNATVQQLITRANDAYNQAQVALRDGNWGAYGEQMTILQTTLQQLANAAGE